MLHKRYPVPENPTYLDDLSYTVLAENLAHALSYPENWDAFRYDAFLEEKYQIARQTFQCALNETDAEKQAVYRRRADTGNYWDAFASINGKLYLLQHKAELENIYQEDGKSLPEKLPDKVG